MLLRWGRQGKDEGTAKGMLRGGERLEREPVWEMRTRLCSCVIGTEAAGKHLCVSVQQRGRGRRQHSALLSC